MMMNPSHTEWTLIGHGADGDLFAHVSKPLVRKRLTSASRDMVRSDFDRQQQAFLLAQFVEGLAVPEPLSMDPQEPAFTMVRVDGQSLFELLNSTRLAMGTIERLAEQFATGLETFRHLQPDPKLDHALLDRDGVLWFVDFGDGLYDHDNPFAASEAESFHRILGDVLYQTARLRRSTPRRFRYQTALFLRLVAHRLGVRWDGSVTRSAVRHIMQESTSNTLLRNVLRFRLRAAARTIKPETTTRPVQRMASIVWDFPAHKHELHNGLHKAVHGWVTGSRELGSDMQVWTVDGKMSPTSGPETPDAWDGTVRRFPSRRALLRAACSSPDDVLFILNSVFCPWSALLAASLRLSNQLYMVSTHTNLSPAFFRNGRIKKTLYWHAVEKWVLRGAVAIQLLDRRQRDRLVDLKIHTPSFSAVPGIGSAGLAETSKKRPATDAPVRIHFFGRLDVTTKGIDLLLEAIRSVSRDHAVHLYLQGPPTDHPERIHRLIASHHLQSVVSILPPDFETAPADIIGAYDIAVLPSRIEGFSLSAVEALMAGIPLVMTNVSGLADLLESTDVAIVVDPSAEGLERGIRKAIEKKDSWDDNSRRGRAFVADRLSVDAASREFNTGINKVLARA